MLEAASAAGVEDGAEGLDAGRRGGCELYGLGLGVVFLAGGDANFGFFAGQEAVAEEGVSSRFGVAGRGYARDAFAFGGHGFDCDVECLGNVVLYFGHTVPLSLRVFCLRVICEHFQAFLREAFRMCLIEAVFGFWANARKGSRFSFLFPSCPFTAMITSGVF